MQLGTTGFRVGHQRSGELAIIDRTIPLPSICVVTGEKAVTSVPVLFHWKQNNFGASDPAEAIIMGLFFYFYDVPKAKLRIPISRRVSTKRSIGWTLVGGIAFVAVVTIATLLLGQSWIDHLPKSDTKRLFNDFGIPAIALGGFALIALMAIYVHRSMPMLTVLLRVVEISETHIVLSGASEGFLRSLEDSRPAESSTATGTR